MYTWKLSAVAMLVFSIAGGARADDEVTSQPMDEVIVAAHYSAISLTEEVIAAAKRSPALPAITVAVNDLKLSPPRIDAVLREREPE